MLYINALRREKIMRILGIDPGYAIVGWGVIDYENSRFRVVDYGSVQTKAGTDTVERLEKVYQGINTIIERYKPEHMAIEELFFNTNATTAIVVAEARGVTLLAASSVTPRASATTIAVVALVLKNSSSIAMCSGL